MAELDGVKLSNEELYGKNKSLGEQNKKGQANDAAIRYDFGKLRWDLVPYDALEKVVEVYTHGAAKYDDDNWRKGMSYKRMYGSIFRHITKAFRGEDIDPDSGGLHLAMAAWGCLSLIWYLENRPEYDDRPEDLNNPEFQCKGDCTKQEEMFWKILNEFLEKKNES